MRRQFSLLKTALVLIGILMLSSVAAQAAFADEDMVRIPRGEFVMGSHDHADETPHRVVLDSYYIDKYEVSNAEYAKFMKATGHAAPAYWDDPRLNKPNQPVVGVNWFDAKGFCSWKDKRLPTEAEWERAAKGPGGDLHYPWGHTIVPGRANYGQMVGKTTPVDSYPEGQSGFGAYNMAGNVFEWVQDWYQRDYYKNSPALNPQGPAEGYNWANQGPVRVLRGGSWLAPEASLHTSHRFWNQPENNSYGVGLGFRCAKSAEPVSVKAAEMARGHYMAALIAMGDEKWDDAMKHIDQAIKGDPGNTEYRQIRAMIKQTMK